MGEAVEAISDAVESVIGDRTAANGSLRGSLDRHDTNESPEDDGDAGG